MKICSQYECNFMKIDEIFMSCQPNIHPLKAKNNLPLLDMSVVLSFMMVQSLDDLTENDIMQNVECMSSDVYMSVFLHIDVISL